MFKTQSFHLIKIKWDLYWPLFWLIWFVYLRFPQTSEFNVSGNPGWNIDRGGSNEYPRSMFLSKNMKKKMYVYPCTPQFSFIKVRCKGVFITRTYYHDATITIVIDKKKIVTHAYFCSKYRDSFYEYLQFLLYIQEKEENINPCKPQFYFNNIMGFNEDLLFTGNFMILHFLFRLKNVKYSIGSIIGFVF